MNFTLRLQLFRSIPAYLDQVYEPEMQPLSTIVFQRALKEARNQVSYDEDTKEFSVLKKAVGLRKTVRGGAGGGEL